MINSIDLVLNDNRFWIPVHANALTVAKLPDKKNFDELYKEYDQRRNTVTEKGKPGMPGFKNYLTYFRTYRGV